MLETKIIVHCGHNTIGGTKISLIGGNGKGILLDFGWNFKTSKLFLDEFMQLRKHLEIFDAIQLGELPRPEGVLKGIYREDYIKLHPNDAKQFNVITEPPQYIQGVILSHAHADHTGCIKYLHPSIPIYTGRITQLVLEHLNQVKSANSLHKNIISYKDLDENEVNRQIIALEEDKPKNISDVFEITFNETDHSLPGAGAFFIRDTISNKKIIYTGDIRLHGLRSHIVKDFIKKAKKFSPDILICEGTRINDPESKEEMNSEPKIQEGLSKLFQSINESDHPGLIFFESAENDVWRLKSFYNAALSINRTLVLNACQYMLLEKLIQIGYIQDIDLSKINVYLPRKDTCQFDPKDYVNSCDIRSLFKKPESEITYELYKTGEKKGTQKEPSKHETIKIDQPFGINAEVIRSHPDKYVMYLPFYNMKELLDISPPVNSFYVISKSEPFDDEMMIDENKRINWLTRFGMPDDGEHIIRIHCSGHMVKSDLISMLNEISPKFLIPVHTEFPEMFTQSGIYKNIQIIIPQRDQIYNF